MRAAPIPIHIFQVKLFQFLKHLLPPLLSTSDPGRRLAAEERPTLVVVGRALRRADAVAVPGAGVAPSRLTAGLDDLLDRRDDLGAVQPDVRQVVVASLGGSLGRDGLPSRAMGSVAGHLLAVRLDDGENGGPFRAVLGGKDFDEVAKFVDGAGHQALVLLVMHKLEYLLARGADDALLAIVPGKGGTEREKENGECDDESGQEELDVADSRARVKAWSSRIAVRRWRQREIPPTLRRTADSRPLTSRKAPMLGIPSIWRPGRSGRSA